MQLACLDLEGVLVPEIWIGVAERTGLPELRLTTRDVADYDELMDRVAAVTARDDPAEVAQLYAEPDLRVPEALLR